MISEGSCDTEDWSNNAENSALPSQENKLFKQRRVINCYNISQYYSAKSLAKNAVYQAAIMSTES